MTHIIGIDIAKRTFDVATQQDNGKIRTKSGFTNDKAGFESLLKWLEKHAAQDAWIVMEATGIYHEALATFLLKQGFQVAVLNPAQVASYARSQLQRVKTDKADAKLLAEYGKRHSDQLRPWKPDPPSLRQLRALVRRLEDLEGIQQMELNRLDVADENVQASIRALLQHVEQQIKATEQAIRQHIDDDPDLKRQKDLIVSIKGIADKTAALLLAECGDPLQFRSARSLGAFAGLTPRLQESGQYRGRTLISRTGSARLRAKLYMPTLSAIAYNPAIREQAQRLRERGKAGKQIVCAAMRKLLGIVYGVLKSGQPFDVNKALAH